MEHWEKPIPEEYSHFDLPFNLENFCREMDQELLALRRVAEAAEGLKEHGGDLQNGTHANILWYALIALDELEKKK